MREGACLYRHVSSAAAAHNDLTLSCDLCRVDPHSPKSGLGPQHAGKPCNCSTVAAVGGLLNSHPFVLNVLASALPAAAHLCAGAMSGGRGKGVPVVFKQTATYRHRYRGLPATWLNTSQGQLATSSASYQRACMCSLQNGVLWSTVHANATV